VIRLLAALVAPVVVVLALLTWVPDDLSGSGLLSIANTGDEPAVRPVPLAGAGHQDGLESLRRSLADRATATTSRSTTERAAVPAVPADQPAFAVTIDTMAPSVVPTSGPVVMRGRVTNTTDETWTGLNVHPFLSPSPMRTAAEVELAAASDPEIFIDSRIVTPGAFDNSIDELAPGATAHWMVRLPQEVLKEELDGTEGVYWIGVHVLGANSAGRDELADGRARSFIPLIGRNAPVVPTSLVVPFRRSTLHEPDGRVAGEDEWNGELAAGGRLDNLLSFVERSGPGRLTLLVDPAVLDAVAQLAEGNPARDLSPTPAKGEEPPAEGDDEEDPSADQERARSWLDRFVAAASAHRVLALPYADLDLAGAARNNPGLDARARKQSDDVLDELDIAATPVIAPPSGLITDEALSLFDEGETVLLSSEALPPRYADAEELPTVVTSDGRRIAVYDVAVASGGPGPNPRLDPVSLRQRILAEAAVRTLSDDDEPMVVNLPSDFDPGALSRGFFTGLDRPFVRLATTLEDATAEAPEVGDLVYSGRQLQRELDPGNFAATADLIDTGETLDRLLSKNDTIGAEVVRESLGTASYMLRDDPVAASSAAYGATGWIDDRLAKVQLTAPSFVILSADSGPFAVTVTNGLDQPIRLRILARTRDDLVIKAPQTIELEGDKQQSVTLTAQADSIGVHPLRLIATDEAGRPLGASEEISVRSNKVGRIIWVIMGAGVGILFLAIAVRLFRRFRGARAS
jgi:hypothetical protein